MDKLHAGDVVKIASYKHDGSLNRRWEENTVLVVDDNCIIGKNNRTIVTNKTGKKIQTVFPALFYFDNREWFNVIYNMLPHQPFFYCNISSPAKITGKTIQYVDYDIDFVVHPDFTYEIKDLDEYQEHQQDYDYPADVKNHVEQAVDRLQEYIEQQKIPFQTGFIHKWTAKINK